MHRFWSALSCSLLLNWRGLVIFSELSGLVFNARLLNLLVLLTRLPGLACGAVLGAFGALAVLCGSSVVTSRLRTLTLPTLLWGSVFFGFVSAVVSLGTSLTLCLSLLASMRLARLPCASVLHFLGYASGLVHLMLPFLGFLRFFGQYVR